MPLHGVHLCGDLTSMFSLSVCPCLVFPRMPGENKLCPFVMRISQAL